MGYLNEVLSFNLGIAHGAERLILKNLFEVLEIGREIAIAAEANVISNDMPNEYYGEGKRKETCQRRCKKEFHFCIWSNRAGTREQVPYRKGIWIICQKLPL